MDCLCCESQLVIIIKGVCVAQQWLTSDSGIGKENLDFRGGKMSGQSAKKSMNHPDPEPIVNVQVWETRASVIWGLNAVF